MFVDIANNALITSALSEMGGKFEEHMEECVIDIVIMCKITIKLPC